MKIRFLVYGMYLIEIYVEKYRLIYAFLCMSSINQHPDPFKYKHGFSKLQFIDWQAKFIEESNKEKSDQQIVEEIKRLLQKEEEKRQKLKELRIIQIYSGFKEQLKA